VLLSYISVYLSYKYGITSIYCYFISYKESFTTEDLIYTFLKVIIARHETSDEIISNRDKLFTSKFWKFLTKQIEINHKLSTVYHSQTNEQTKRMNQTLKQYLRHYVNYWQTNWMTLLSIAQFAYNATCTKTTKISLFYANHEYESNIAKHETNFIKTHRANMLIAQFKNLYKQLITNLRFLAMRSKIYYDRRRFEEIDLKMKKKVFLLRKNLRITKKSNKLNHVKIKSFRILKNIKKTNFELKLSNNMKKNTQFFTHFCWNQHTQTHQYKNYRTNISNLMITRKNMKSKKYWTHS
jgi:hypothetical protein